MTKRVLIAVGGTGGHLFPALAFAEKMQSHCPQLTCHFVGGGLVHHFSQLQQTFPYSEISSAPLGLNRSLFSNGWKIARGVKQSLRLIGKLSPDLVVGFGSFFAFPTLLAAKMKRLPLVLHEGNCLPGKVTRLFSRFAKVTGCSLPVLQGSLCGENTLVGMPLSRNFVKGARTREEAARYFSLDPKLLTVLFFGGSQGAASLNTLFFEGVHQLGNTLKGQFQLLHFVGGTNPVEGYKKLYEQCGIRACVKPFEKEMAYAWEMADIAIGRAGASTLAEALLFEVPMLLIPYPFAAENHQEKNGRFFEEIGAATLLLQKGLTGERLIEALLDLVKRRSLVQEALRGYKAKREESDFCQVVERYL